MRILGLDASTMVGSVALVADGVVEGEYTLKVKRTHSERLLPAVARVLADADLTVADVDAVSVAVGPGSFTGLRIALATAKGLAYARGLPVVGVGTLDVLAAPWWWFPGLVLAMLDARRGEVYAAAYRGGIGREPGAPEAVVEPVACSFDDFMRRVGETASDSRIPAVAVGDAGAKHWEEVRALFGERVQPVPEAAAISRASWVAELGCRKLAAEGPDDVFRLSPLYLRPPEAESKLKKGQVGQAQPGGTLVREELTF